jgi:hypothetical protein
MRYFLILLLLISNISCNQVKEKAKDAINTTGEITGTAASEFAKGVTEGIDKSYGSELILSQNILDKGISFSQFSFESNNYSRNILRVYLIFSKDCNSTLVVKSFNKEGKENGRTTLQIDEKTNNAKFFDFVFDEKTYLESNSKIIIE